MEKSLIEFLSVNNYRLGKSRPSLIQLQNDMIEFGSKYNNVECFVDTDGIYRTDPILCMVSALAGGIIKKINVAWSAERLYFDYRGSSAYPISYNMNDIVDADSALELSDFTPSDWLALEMIVSYFSQYDRGFKDRLEPGVNSPGCSLSISDAALSQKTEFDQLRNRLLCHPVIAVLAHHIESERSFIMSRGR